MKEKDWEIGYIQGYFDHGRMIGTYLLDFPYYSLDKKERMRIEEAARHQARLYNIDSELYRKQKQNIHKKTKAARAT